MLSFSLWVSSLKADVVRETVILGVPVSHPVDLELMGFSSVGQFLRRCGAAPAEALLLRLKSQLTQRQQQKPRIPLFSVVLSKSYTTHVMRPVIFN